MALDEISKKSAKDYAAEYIGKLVGSDGKISVEKLQSPPSVFTLNPEKMVFFNKVAGFLKDFANKDEDYLRENKALLTPARINSIASEMIEYADHNGKGKGKDNGKVSISEADNAIASFDPKTAFQKKPNSSTVAMK